MAKPGAAVVREGRMTSYALAGSMQRKKSARWKSTEVARAAIRRSLATWFAATFPESPYSGDASELSARWGPRSSADTARVKAADAERQAAAIVDRLYSAMHAGSELARTLESPAGPMTGHLQRLFPPSDGGASAPWPSLRGWLGRLQDDHRKASVALGARPELTGLRYLVWLLDNRNVLGLANVQGRSRFLSNTEMAKIAILAGYWPHAKRWPSLDTLTQGSLVAVVARDVRDLRVQVGQLSTPDDQSRMGVGARRGPRPST